MMHFFTSFSAALFLLSLGLRVNAHGYVLHATVDGTDYTGSNGPDASSDSPIRKVSSNSPVTDPTSNDIICGLSAEKASSSATANPGSTLEFYWGTISGGNWFHNVGPILTYMASCSGDCSSFSPDSSTEWFKIDEQGESVDGDSSTWAQAKLTDGSPATVKIPDGLAAGNYLVRNEIISLQNAVSEGGAEYYPSCLQVTVGGNDSGQPDTTVHFPGAYSETDPGILGDFYTSSSNYQFPGGPVATITDSGSSSGSSSDSGSSTARSTVTASSSAASEPKASSSTASDPATPSDSAAPADQTGSFDTAAVPTQSLPGVGNVGASPSASSTSGAATATISGKCRATKKRQLHRRSPAPASNGTTSSSSKPRSLKMHKRRSAHQVSY